MVLGASQLHMYVCTQRGKDEQFYDAGEGSSVAIAKHSDLDTETTKLGKKTKVFKFKSGGHLIGK